jgi:transglutaminase-like putative cysteine protease
MHKIIVFLVGGMLCLCGKCAVATERAKAEQAGPHIVAGREQKVTVVFTVRIIHSGKKPLQDPQIRMRLPLEMPHQDVDALDIEGRPRRELDRWKETVLIYRQPDLLPGHTLTGRWTAECRIRELRWNLKGQRDNRISPLSAEEKALYLRDAKNFALNDPAIKTAAREATAGRRDIVSKLEGIHDFVMKHLEYSRDGRWEPAPVVLASGKGSCSEYTYLFVALCRANGIPARYAGGITGRPGKPLYVDLVYHRFAQAFVEGIGWVDFDPTRDDRTKSHRVYFGHTPHQMLLLCAGDGGRGSLTAWDYRCIERWKGKGEQEDDDGENTPNYIPTVVVRVGWWFPEPPAEIRRKVAVFRRQLARTPPERRGSLIDAALKIGHPFVLPWLDDLLYDPATRIDAARAFLKIDGTDSLVAVVDTLARQNDREGDRQIGELLNVFTSKHFGADRKKWKNWLKTHVPPSPPSVSSARPVASKQADYRCRTDFRIRPTVSCSAYSDVRTSGRSCVARHVGSSTAAVPL